MKTFSAKKRILSVFLALLMAVSALTPAMTAFAGGVVGYYEIQLFYNDGVIVPEKDESGEDHIEYLAEGETLQLNYQLIDCELPDNGYVTWYSETPTLVDVNEKGLVKAYDSSKGAVVQSWIDNEVKTIPLVGKIMATVLEKALFNEYVDLDTMDTDAIVAVVDGAFGEDSVLAKYIDSYKGDLINSLREYLDNINSNIHATLYDAEGNQLADDYVQICVTKSDKIYADFLPNGTHITNKQAIETTVAKGSSVQLTACTTPTRLHMGVIYSVKSSSIFTQGKVVATVNDSGLVTFKNTGQVTIVVSPDTEGFINNLLSLVNYFYKLDNTGTLDTDKIAGILIDYVGIDMNRTVLAGILDVCFAIYDVAQDSADPVQLTATAVQILSNLILQFVYNDKITFNVVDGAPCTDFTISGASTVTEGSQIQLAITDAKPVAADTSDITWASSDESVAYVDPVTGVITGRDAGGSLGSFSQKTAVITATSAANNVSKSVTITVTGKTGRYLSDAIINADTSVNIGDEQDLAYTVYPQRVATANNLYLTWGLVTAGTDAESYEYLWAQDPYEEEVTDEATGEVSTVAHDGTVTDNIGKIDSKGHYTAVAGGTAKVALKVVTGYYITKNNFYEISSVIAVLDIFNGQPVTAINLSAIDVTSGGTLSTKDVEINGVVYHYATCKKTVADAYFLNGVKAKATVLPEDATNKKVKWSVDNSNFEIKNQDNDANTVEFKMKSGVEVADSANVTAVSEDGEVLSDNLTICVTRNYATGNKIDADELSVTNGKTTDATHTMTFSGSWTSGAYACYDANWYSSNENVFTVKNKGNDNNDAVLTGVDVGTATLYCVSADGGILDEATVTVYPNKDYLRSIVRLCEDTVIKRTDANKLLYKDYSRKLDFAYYVLYDEEMASQDTCDTYAKELLYAFYKLGGFIGLNGVEIVKNDGTDAGEYLSVPVSTTSYKSTSYNLVSQVLPKRAMYSSIVWSSSSDSISVDKNGKCTPTSNNACWSVITCTATDYMGTVFTDSVCISFTKTAVTGISLDTQSISGGKVGETKTIKATISPTGTLGVGKASIQDVIWASSDEKVATVQGGVVTFNYGGDCVITATTCDGGYTATCTVNVVTNYDALAAQIDTYKSLNLVEGNYYPATWEKYSNAITDSETMIAKNIATQPEVDKQLQVLIDSYKGLEKYTYINKVEIYLDGEAASEFYQYDLSLLSEGISYTNAKLDLNVRLYPNNASYDNIKWESSTDEIAITEDGIASPAKNTTCYGQIKCTVTDHFGNQWTDTVWVSFAYTIVTGVKLSESSIAGAVGDTHQLTATVEPTGSSLLHIGAASIKDYYWESDNENIATVDSTGLVTFVSTGATTVRAVSYDGGIFGECSVSTGGDRNALKAALAQYKDTDYMDYEYSYGIAFKSAYDTAQTVMDDISKTQEEIDAAAQALIEAGASLVGHEIISVESLQVNWEGYKLSSLKGSGQVSTDTNSLSINMNKGGYGSLHYANSVVLNASALPAGADAQAIVWTVDSETSMKNEISGSKLTLTPTSTSADSCATVTVTATDSYGRTFSRTINVIMAWNTVTGITLDRTEVEMKATDAPLTLTPSLATSGSTSFNSVTWTSNNESVATVDENGAVTPHEIGIATITATTFDGGYTASCKVTVAADYTQLQSKYTEYNTLIEDVTGDYVYTDDSLEALRKTVADTKTMIDNYRSTQAEVDAQLQAMNDAYNGLVKYIIATGVSVTADTATQNNVTIPNDGYIRYTNGTSINGKTIQLTAKTSPEGGLYTGAEWTSSNSNITVDENGLCTNNSANAGYSVITCKITTIKGDTYTSSAYVSFTRYGVESISLDDVTVYGAPQAVAKLSPTVKSSTILSNLVIKDCTYKSSDESVATVDNNGVVTFVSQGTATITATSCDGGFTTQATAYTTWDTSALSAALADAKDIVYTDYAYSFGMAFKTAYDKATEVYADYTSSQDAIDTACYNLTEAMSKLQGNEFVKPGDISIMSGDEALADGHSVVVNDSKQATLVASYAQGAMVKSTSWSMSGAENVTAQVSDGKYVLTKAEGATSGTATVTVKLIDDYDREYTKSVTVKLVDAKVSISSFAFTYDGQEITTGAFSCGGIYSLKTFQLGVNTYPAEADAYSSITWSSSSSNVKVSSTGVLSASGFASSYSATITCVLTLEDGSTVTNTLPVTITRS